MNPHKSPQNPTNTHQYHSNYLIIVTKMTHIVRKALYSDLPELQRVYKGWIDDSPFPPDPLKFDKYLIDAITSTLYGDSAATLFVSSCDNNITQSGYAITGPSQIPHCSSLVYETRYLHVDAEMPKRDAVKAVEALAQMSVQEADRLGYEFCVLSLIHI